MSRYRVTLLSTGTQSPFAASEDCAVTTYSELKPRINPHWYLLSLKDPRHKMKVENLRSVFQFIVDCVCCYFVWYKKVAIHTIEGRERTFSRRSA
jgi:hypothetical protein